MIIKKHAWSPSSNYRPISILSVLSKLVALAYLGKYKLIRISNRAIDFKDPLVISLFVIVVDKDLLNSTSLRSIFSWQLIKFGKLSLINWTFSLTIFVLFARPSDICWGQHSSTNQCRCPKRIRTWLQVVSYSIKDLIWISIQSYADDCLSELDEMREPMSDSLSQGIQWNLDWRFKILLKFKTRACTLRSFLIVRISNLKKKLYDLVGFLPQSDLQWHKPVKFIVCIAAKNWVHFEVFVSYSGFDLRGAIEIKKINTHHSCFTASTYNSHGNLDLW